MMAWIELEQFSRNEYVTFTIDNATHLLPPHESPAAQAVWGARQLHAPSFLASPTPAVTGRGRLNYKSVRVMSEVRSSRGKDGVQTRS